MMGVALIHLEGKALDWFYEWETTEFKPAFKKDLRQEFRYGRKSEAVLKMAESLGGARMAQSKMEEDGNDDWTKGRRT